MIFPERTKSAGVDSWHSSVDLCIITVSIDERRPKMYLLFSHSKNGKFAPFLTYLKIWWKVVLDFGKEHANWSNISEVMIGWSWKIKFGKINYFFGYTNFEFSKLDFLTSSYHNSTNTGPIDMIFTKKCNYFSRGTRWDHPFLSQSQ